MSLLQHVNLLKRRCHIQLQKNDVLLARQVNKLRSIQQQIQELDESVSSIKKVRDGLSPYGEYSRDKLFAVQRSQAALRRKIADLTMQRSQKVLQMNQCESEQEKLSQYKRVLMKQSDKYEYLRKQEVRHRYLQDIRLEENEIEERIACHK